jgi:hypothetical protein
VLIFVPSQEQRLAPAEEGEEAEDDEDKHADGEDGDVPTGQVRC